MKSASNILKCNILSCLSSSVFFYITVDTKGDFIESNLEKIAVEHKT